jgi:hypothetical protein
MIGGEPSQSNSNVVTFFSTYLFPHVPLAYVSPILTGINYTTSSSPNEHVQHDNLLRMQLRG